MAAKDGIVYLCIYSLADGDKHLLKVHCFTGNPALTKARVENMLPREGTTIHYLAPAKNQKDWIPEFEAAKEAIEGDPSHVPINNKDLMAAVANEAGIPVPGK